MYVNFSNGYIYIELEIQNLMIRMEMYLWHYLVLNPCFINKQFSLRDYRAQSRSVSKCHCGDGLLISWGYYSFQNFLLPPLQLNAMRLLYSVAGTRNKYLIIIICIICWAGQEKGARTSKMADSPAKITDSPAKI